MIQRDVIPSYKQSAMRKCERKIQNRICPRSGGVLCLPVWNVDGWMDLQRFTDDYKYLNVHVQDTLNGMVNMKKIQY